MSGERVTDELRCIISELVGSGDMSHDMSTLLNGIADRIDIHAEDEVSYALAQQLNDREAMEDSLIAYAHDTGFDEGWQAGHDEPKVCPRCGMEVA